MAAVGHTLVDERADSGVLHSRGFQSRLYGRDYRGNFIGRSRGIELAYYGVGDVASALGEADFIGAEGRNFVGNNLPYGVAKDVFGNGSGDFDAGVRGKFVAVIEESARHKVAYSTYCHAYCNYNHAKYYGQVTQFNNLIHHRRTPPS